MQSMNSIQKLDLSSLEKAIFQLEDSLRYFHTEAVQEDERLKLHMRAAAIQAFEFTYELSWKMIKRYLEMTEPDPTEIDHMSFPNFIRTACERGLLLSDVSVWKKFREERSITSHTYNQQKAIEVFEKIPEFLKEAKFLYAQLKDRSKS